MPRPRQKPSYLLHRSTGQARTIIRGKTFYLGPFGSPESRAKYDDLVAEWLDGKESGRCRLTVDDLVLKYLRHADQFYRHPDGSPTSEPACIRQAVRFAVQVHGTTHVRSFGPIALKEVRKAMIDAGLCRTTINKSVHRIRRMFAWGVENELFPAAIHEALKRVASLKAGRSDAAEPVPVEPVADDIVEATLPHLPATLQAMVRLQLLTGCRPGEICRLRPCDVTFGTDGVWTFRPPHHKTRHRGKDRRIFFGPKAQAILRPYLSRPASHFCFSPKESEAARNAERREQRKSPMTPSQSARTPSVDRQRKPKDHYAKDSYCRSIARACVLAGVEPWSPNQLRHSRATILRKLYGIEGARLVLGHADAGVTLVYAERDFEAAAKIMMEVG